MNESKMFAPEGEKEQKPVSELTPEEIEQLVINIPLEDMKPLPEELRKKVEALKKKWEEEHKES